MFVQMHPLACVGNVHLCVGMGDNRSCLPGPKMLLPRSSQRVKLDKILHLFDIMSKDYWIYMNIQTQQKINFCFNL